MTIFMTYNMTMIKVNIHQLKANPSHYVDLVQKGTRVIICKRNIPVAELTPMKPIERPPLGLGVGTAWIADDFNKTSQDIIDAFEGNNPDDPLLS
jgi:prevent-host-death family protein